MNRSKPEGAGIRRHRPKGNSRLGFSLALSTAFLWGFLAVALKLLMGGMDAFTITWYRLSSAGLVLAIYQWQRGRLPDLRRLDWRGWGMLVVALLGLTGNYVLFVLSLDYVPPATAQLVIQLAPLFFLLGSLLVFKESFSRVQWSGLAVLVLGLGLFFNQRVIALIQMSGREAHGVAIVGVAAVVWAAYALAQKQLLLIFSSENILLLIYVGATLLLLPFSSPMSLKSLTGVELALLAFGVFNTIAAYGCFAEALEHWEASRVSAVIALAPLITIAVVYGALAVWPDIEVGSRLDSLGLLGAALIVLGSVMAALGKKP